MGSTSSNEESGNRFAGVRSDARTAGCATPASCSRRPDLRITLQHPECRPHLRNEVVGVDNAMWSWTTFDGKFVGCPRWTKLAIQRYVEFDGKRGWKKHLRHEHIVPRSVVSQLVLALPKPTPDSVSELFSALVIGCVVDRSEDAILNRYRSSMPSEFDEANHAAYRNPWLRYERCGIDIYTDSVTEVELNQWAKKEPQVRGKK